MTVALLSLFFSRVVDVPLLNGSAVLLTPFGLSSLLFRQLLLVAYILNCKGARRSVNDVEIFISRTSSFSS